MYNHRMTPETHPYCRCLFYSANALARATTRVAEQVFAPVGLAPSAAYVLMTVLREPGTSPGHIAEVMMLDRSTVTRLLERLEAKGLVRRKARGRAVEVSPTPAAGTLKRRLASCARTAAERFGKLVGQEMPRLTSDVFAAAVRMEGATPGR
jgi:DNA-binding MarR family transcriptional regulator